MEVLIALLVGIALGAAGCAAVLLGRLETQRRRRQAAIDAELAAARTRAERATSEAQALRARLVAVEVQAARADALDADLAAAQRQLAASRAPTMDARHQRSMASVAGGSTPSDVPGSLRRPGSTARSQAAPPEPAPTARSQAAPSVSAVGSRMDVPQPVSAARPADDPDAGPVSIPGAAVPGPRVTAPQPADGPESVPASYPANEPEPVVPSEAETGSAPAAGRRRRSPSRSAAPSGPADPAGPEPPAARSAGPDSSAADTSGAEDPDPDGWQPIRPGLSNPRRWLGTTAPNGTMYGEDDLERIHGVGPYLARRLRDAGIVTWRQVAEWDEDDMTLMSRLIGSFPDRIRREDWPASARALHEEAYGEVLP